MFSKFHRYTKGPFHWSYHCGNRLLTSNLIQESENPHVIYIRNAIEAFRDGHGHLSWIFWRLRKLVPCADIGSILYYLMLLNDTKSLLDNREMAYVCPSHCCESAASSTYLGLSGTCSPQKTTNPAIWPQRLRLQGPRLLHSTWHNSWICVCREFGNIWW